LIPSCTEPVDLDIFYVKISRRLFLTCQRGEGRGDAGDDEGSASRVLLLPGDGQAQWGGPRAVLGDEHVDFGGICAVQEGDAVGVIFQQQTVDAIEEEATPFSLASAPTASSPRKWRR
jgi:hypothetical protein